MKPPAGNLACHGSIEGGTCCVQRTRWLPIFFPSSFRYFIASPVRPRRRTIPPGGTQGTVQRLPGPRALHILPSQLPRFLASLLPCFLISLSPRNLGRNQGKNLLPDRQTDAVTFVRIPNGRPTQCPGPEDRPVTGPGDPRIRRSSIQGGRDAPVRPGQPIVAMEERMSDRARQTAQDGIDAPARFARAHTRSMATTPALMDRWVPPKLMSRMS